MDDHEASTASIPPIGVIVVDDQAMIRDALSLLLNLEDDIAVIGQATNGQDALDFIKHSDDGHIDVALMDVDMPVMDGITACAAITQRFPAVKVLMLTTFGRPGYVQRALQAGACGFIVKDAPSEELAQSVRAVAEGKHTVDPSLALETLVNGANPMTEREIDVLRAVSKGGTIADVARAMNLSQGTVRNYVSSTMVKTNARTRAEAVRLATENGWL